MRPTRSRTRSAEALREYGGLDRSAKPCEIMFSVSDVVCEFWILGYVC